MVKIKSTGADVIYTYRILYSASSLDMSEMVTEMLNKGWNLNGNLVVTMDDRSGTTTTFFHQAMTKTEKRVR